MGESKIEEILKSLSEHGIERARPELAQEIKARIPSRLSVRPWDTISIIVDLRISRLAAAAVILLAMLLIGVFLGSRDSAGARMYDDIRYTLGGENACRAEFLGNLARFRDQLKAQGREVVYYGDQANPKDPFAIIMYWKLPDDKYGVILSDLTARTVSTKMLITLQDYMLQTRSSK